MIKFNRQMNCSCMVEAGPCPNGEAYRERCNTKAVRSQYARAVANGMDLVEARRYLPHVREAKKMEDRRELWEKVSPFLAWLGIKQYPVSISYAESLLDDNRQEQVTSKKGTKNDLARIAELRLMDSILSDHAIALKHKNEFKLLSVGVEWLLHPVISVTRDNSCVTEFVDETMSIGVLSGM